MDMSKEYMLVVKPTRKIECHWEVDIENQNL